MLNFVGTSGGLTKVAPVTLVVLAETDVLLAG